MSRSLPARPNLEFLKNEAKDLLDRLRSTDPSAQLSDAQHALSIEYGFASWPKLKAHIEATMAQASPFEGRWIADVSLSKRHPANQFQRATMVFAVRGDTIDVSSEFVDEAGKVVRGRYSFQADGVEYPQPHGYGLTASWRGTRMLDTVATQHGQVVSRGHYTVSADGRRMTVTGDQHTIVLDRVLQ